MTVPPYDNVDSLQYPMRIDVTTPHGAIQKIELSGNEGIDGIEDIEGIKETDGWFVFDLASGRSARISQARSAHDGEQTREPIQLLPGAEYVISMRASGDLAAANVTVLLFQHLTNGGTAKHAATLDDGGAWLVVHTGDDMRAVSLALQLEGRGRLRPEGVTIREIDVPILQIGEQIRAARDKHDLLDLAHLLYRRSRRGNESERYQLRRAAETLCERLEQMHGSGAPATLSATRARLYEIQLRWEEARDTWHEVVSSEPIWQADAIHALGRCELRLGNLDEAHRWFDRAAPALRHSQTFQRDRRALQQAQAQSRRSIVLTLEAESHPSAASRRQRRNLSAAFRTELPRRRARQLAKLWQDFAAIVDDRFLGHTASRACLRRIHSHHPTPVTNTGLITSGFGWSGSGAVNDWLREFREIRTPFGGMESAVFMDKIGMPGIKTLRPLADTARQQAREQLDSAARESRWLAYLRARRRAATTPSPDVQQLLTALKRFFLFSVLSEHRHALRRQMQGGTELFHRFISNCYVFLAELERIDWSRQASFDALSRAIAALYWRCAADKADNPKAVLLFNNVINGINISLLASAPQCIQSIIVFRDPRDQFVAQTYESNRRRRSVEEFIVHVNRAHALYRSETKNPDLSSRIREVQFEEFVTSDICRRELAASLDLSQDSEMAEQYFKPCVSAGNIGIYKNFADQSAIRKIARACHALTLEDPAGR